MSETLANIGVKTAAAAVRVGGIIDDNQFARLTDGTVSWADLSLARAIVANGGSDIERDLGRLLESAIEKKLEYQTFGKTLGESLGDWVDALGRAIERI